MKFLLLCSFLCLSFCSIGQASMTVDHMQARIGDQVRATIKVNVSGGKEWANVDNMWPDTSKQYEIVSGPEIKHDDPASTSATWVVALFDTGWVRLPALPLIMRSADHVDTVFTNDVPVQVKPVQPDSTGLIPIKEIYKQPFNIAYYKKYIPHALAAALIIFGLIYWWRHRKRKELKEEIVVIEPLPHDWAFNALNELEAKRLWQGGDVKEHYSLLTSVLREYLERRYGIRALEQTSDEIIEQLRLQHLSTSLLQDTTELLSISDMIKFAKADPGIDIHAATIERVRNFVRQTLLITPLVSSSPEKPAADETVA